MEAIINAIYESGISISIRESETLFPVIESLHVIFICLVMAFIFWVDIRLAWMGYRDLAVTAIKRIALPIVWVAFGGAVVTGALLFSSIAPDYVANPYFLAKMATIAFAGINMTAFHVLLHFNLLKIDDEQAPPVAARVFGLTSIILWTTVISLGRYIGFTL